MCKFSISENFLLILKESNPINIQSLHQTLYKLMYFVASRLDDTDTQPPTVELQQPKQTTKTSYSQR